MHSQETMRRRNTHFTYAFFVVFWNVLEVLPPYQGTRAQTAPTSTPPVPLALSQLRESSEQSSDVAQCAPSVEVQAEETVSADSEAPGRKARWDGEKSRIVLKRKRDGRDFLYIL